MPCRLVVVAAAGFIASLSLFASREASAQALTTAFTYQGQLRTANNPANGTFDLRFRLLDSIAGGGQVGSTLCYDNIAVIDGLFTASLDFGAVFTGQQRFLEIEVRSDTGLNCGSAIGFIALTPRQPLAATPNALFALSATQFNGQPPAFYQNAANLTTGTLSASRLPVPISLSGSNAAGILIGQNSSTADESSGIFGESNAAFGQTAGVWGVSHSSAGRGVTGIAEATSGFTVGVYGQSMSLNGGAGLFGEAIGTTGSNVGVLGTTVSTGGSGVIGTSIAITGVTYGGRFENNSTSGGGLRADATAESGTTFGLAGYSSSEQGVGVLGKAGSPTGNTFGGDFVSDSDSGVGVRSRVVAATPSVNGVNGVLGEATATAGLATGGRFTSESTSGRGVVGSANAASGLTYGVQGFVGSPDGRAVFGYATSPNGATYAGNFVANSSAGTGVYAEANSPTGTTYGGYFMCGSPSGFAGYFVGTKNYFSGNVGIGTTAPTAKLDVAGNVNSSGNLAVAGTITHGSTNRTYAIHGAELHQAQGDYQGVIVNDLGITNVDASASTVFYGAVHLPDNATIILLELRGLDAFANNDMSCVLGRTSYTGTASGIASVVTGVGTTTWQTASMTTPVVDNDLYSYWVRVTMGGGLLPGTEHKVYGIRIVYSITQPLP